VGKCPEMSICSGYSSLFAFSAVVRRGFALKGTIADADLGYKCISRTQDGNVIPNLSPMRSSKHVFNKIAQQTPSKVG
jgi:hypothetical protein